MQRFVFALATVLAIASSAQAVSVAIAPDKPTYLPGETVTLSVTVDAREVPSDAVYGRIGYDPAILLGGTATQSELTSFAGAIPWTLGTLDCGDGYCEAFSQNCCITPLPADQGPDFLISTMTFTAGAIGTTSIEWDELIPHAFYFFGLTSAPGTTVMVVPEPGTGALFALGLVGLASARARPRS